MLAFASTATIVPNPDPHSNHRSNRKISGPMPTELDACQAMLTACRAELSESRRQRDALKAALDSIHSLANTAAISSTPTAP